MKLTLLVNKPLKYLAIFGVLIFTTLLLVSPSFAELSKETSSSSTSDTQDSSNRVSKFLDKFRKQNTSGSTAQKQHSTSKNQISVAKKQAANNKPAKINYLPSKQTSSNTAFPRKKAFLDIIHKIYIRADYGAGLPDKIQAVRFKSSAMYGGGIGYKFNQVIRADINFQRRKLRAKEKVTFDTINHSSIFLNTYLNLMDESSYVIPFITAGIGYSENQLKNFEFSGTYKGETASIVTKASKTKNAVWNAGVGASLRLTKNINIEATYKYIDIGKIKLQNTVTTVNGTVGNIFDRRRHVHEIAGGLVINF